MNMMFNGFLARFAALAVFLLAACSSSSSNVTDDGGPDSDATSSDATTDGTADQQVLPDVGPPVEGWAKALGSSGDEQGTAVAVDDTGNIYVTGHFTDQVDLGDGAKTSKGSDDVFVASFSAGGELRWAVQLGGVGTDKGNAIAVSAGGVFVAGEFRDSADFGEGLVKSTGDSDVFVASFAADSGKMHWSRQFGGVSNDYGRGIAVGGDGNVIVGGQYQKTMTVGDKTLESNGHIDAFVVSYTADGDLRWAKGYGGSDDDNVYGAAADVDGNAYITGYFFGRASLGGNELPNKANAADLFIASYNAADGTHRWSVSGGGVQNDRGIGLAISKGKLYVSGRFVGPGDFGGGAVPAGGAFDIVLGSYNTADGSFNWAKGFGGDGHDFGQAVAVDRAGNVYLAGGSEGLDFGNGAKESKGLGDVVIASFDADGVVRWSKWHGSDKEDNAKGIAVSPQGNVCVTGFIGGPADFASDEYSDMKDLFLIQIKP